MNYAPIIIELDGKVVAKGRGRIGQVKTKDGKQFSTIFTPANTRSYESALRYAASQAMKGRDPIEGPVEIFIEVALDVPKGFGKKKASEALAGIVRPCTKPDIDNYVKSAMDGLNTIVFKDDNQVVSLHAFKRYSNKPSLHIEVRECYQPKGSDLI